MTLLITGYHDEGKTARRIIREMHKAYEATCKGIILYNHQGLHQNLHFRYKWNGLQVSIPITCFRA